MPLRRAKATGGQRRPLPGHGYFYWSSTIIGAIAIAWALLWLAAWTAGQEPPVTVEWWEPLKILVSVGAKTAIGLSMAIWIGFGIRGIRIRQLARKPGPIEIEVVQDATKGLDAPVAELTSAFRAALADVHLYPPSSVPGNSAPKDFVELVSHSVRPPKPRALWGRSRDSSARRFRPAPIASG